MDKPTQPAQIKVHITSVANHAAKTQQHRVRVVLI